MNENTFGGHLRDLRYLILKGVVVFAFFFVFLIIFNDQLANIVVLPLLTNLEPHELYKSLECFQNSGLCISNDAPTLNFLNPVDPLIFRLEIVLIFALLSSLPFLIFLVLKYLAPVFDNKFKNKLILFTLLSILIVVIASSFAYFIVIPFSLRFFIDLGNSLEYTQTSITATGYLAFFKTILLATNIVFQVPLLLYLSLKMKLLKRSLITNNRKFLYLGSISLLFVLVPGDISISIFLVLPFIIMVEFALQLSR